MSRWGEGRKAHNPDEKSRKFVEAMAASGIDQDSIGRVVGVSDATLRKHYAEELATAAAKANAMVGQSLFHQAVGGPERDWTKASTTAGIWWEKTRMGRREPKHEVALSGSVGSYDLTKLSDEDLQRLKSILAPATGLLGNPSGNSAEGSA
jgi:hypothetical protein